MGSIYYSITLKMAYTFTRNLGHLISCMNLTPFQLPKFSSLGTHFIRNLDFIWTDSCVDSFELSKVAHVGYRIFRAYMTIFQSLFCLLDAQKTTFDHQLSYELWNPRNSACWILWKALNAPNPTQNVIAGISYMLLKVKLQVYSIVALFLTKKTNKLWLYCLATR